MENTKKRNIWKPIALVALCLLLVVSTLYGLGVGYTRTLPTTRALHSTLTATRCSACGRRRAEFFILDRTMPRGRHRGLNNDKASA